MNPMRFNFSGILAIMVLAAVTSYARGRTAPPPYGAGLGNIGNWLEPGPVWGWDNDPWGWGDGGDGGWGDGIDGGWGPVHDGKGSGGAGWGGWHGDHGP